MIGEHRKRIDEIDGEIVRLFAERLAEAGEIAADKKKGGLPVLDSAREREIIGRLTKGLPDGLAARVKTLYGVIFELSRAHQAELLGLP